MNLKLNKTSSIVSSVSGMLPNSYGTVCITLIVFSPKYDLMFNFSPTLEYVNARLYQLSPPLT